jgi:hypothetical protein
MRPASLQCFPPLLARRRLSFLIVLLFLLFLLHALPPVFSQRRNRRVVGGKWLPNYDVDELPRYLHRSPYREKPDIEFERRVREALEGIEKDALAAAGIGDGRLAEQRIWQIRLGGDGDDERGKDSLAFTEMNGEWEYAVSTSYRSRERRL